MTESLETPAAPHVAQRVFHVKRLPLAERYAGWLADAGTVRGLIGPREVPRLWERHILNCAVLAEAIPANATVADVGSGAGLPGLVLAIARPDLRLTLIEPLLRRTTFLQEVVDDLSLTNVEVVRGRADVLHGVRTFDAVTSRAVAGLDRLLEWSMPLVAPTGSLVAMKGSSVEEEIDAARPVLDRLGCAEPEVSAYGEGLLMQPTTVVRVSWADPSRISWQALSARSAGSHSGGSQRRKGKGRR
jgi:16S rRNA (guanine527-N7)-methyltransferase